MTVVDGEQNTNLNCDESEQSISGGPRKNSLRESSVSKISDIGDIFAVQKARQQAKQIKRDIPRTSSLESSNEKNVENSPKPVFESVSR